MTTRGQRRRWRWRALTVLSALVLVAAAACGDDDDDTEAAGGSLEDYRRNGLRIGIANEEPYGYEEGGEATGEAPELAKEIFSRLGIEEVSYRVVDFSALINGLNAGRLDVIAAGMFINPDRADQVFFADPDYCAATAFAVPEGNPMGLTDFDTVQETGARLGVLAGAVEETYAQDLGIEPQSFQTTADLFDALTAGRVDAVALTSATIQTQAGERSGIEATEGFIPVINGEEQLGCGAFGFRYEDAELRNAFNAELRAMHDAGEILPIIEPFGFTEADVEAAKEVTANELAGGAYDDLVDGNGNGDSEDGS